MDKNAIKKYAVWARRELIERVSQRALLYGISADAQADAAAVIVNGQALSQTEQKQRKALIGQIEEKGYAQVMEEVAYTWFNRFAALRFMEVNGYLPSHIRVFTDDDGNFKPQILTEAIHLELDGLNMEKVYALERENKKEELFKYLLIVQCNALSSILPGMFQKIEDYTELLLPDYLLREGSAIEQMVTLIPEEDWTDQVQIIGWLYQYYNIEPKAKVLSKSGKISKREIPAATQLFTPDWIVHYMVENSLGRLWLEGHPDSASALLPTEEEQAAYAAGERSPGDTKWHYYLEEAQQEPEVEAQLQEIRKEYAALKPEEILCIDPCMGSGHILCVLFDVLVRIYEDYGYTAREAVVSIVQNNLWGLDIDDRAAQLAYFAVMMKARQYDRRFFSRHIQPHVYAIAESNHMDRSALAYFCEDDPALTAAMNQIMEELHDAKEYGSILTTSPQDWEVLYARFDAIYDGVHLEREAALELLQLVYVAQALSQKYHVVVTNPPYQAVSGLEPKASDFIRKMYPNSKNDLYSVFIERCRIFTRKNSYQAMITQQAWMFTVLYEALRVKLNTVNITALVQLGARAFDEISGEVVQATSFIFRNTHCRGHRGNYIDLTEGKSESEKESIFLRKNQIYETKYEDFSGVPNFSMAYWLSPQALKVFGCEKLGVRATTREGMTTANNERFLRGWYEVKIGKIGFNCLSVDESIDAGYKWFPYNKGGLNRKWYGNNELVVNWENDGSEIRNIKDEKTGRIRSHNYNAEYTFRESGTWTAICSGDIMVRYSKPGALFDSKGASVFAKNYNDLLYIIGLLNSKISGVYLKVLSPSFEYKVGHVANVPVIYSDEEEVVRIVEECISLAKEDWDSYEFSWDFRRHPLIPNGNGVTDYTLEEAYKFWGGKCKDRFEALKSYEEVLNHIFINKYGFQGELSPEVDEHSISVFLADKTRDVKSLISYAVGCIFGRYSLDNEGIVFAGGKWLPEKYISIPADRDAIIPICDDEYFTDDIVGLFVKFIETVYGADPLEENLRFIADALGGSGTSREVIRNYFLTDFYKDHLKTYQKRPIYWLFDSGKKNGFKCLIYMHRYQPDTIARIRTDYVHEQQSRYRTAIADLEQRIDGASTSERVKLKRQLQKLQGQSEEVRVYEEKIHHLADQFIAIDLDDGVKVNYAKFQDVLAKIK